MSMASRAAARRLGAAAAPARIRPLLDTLLLACGIGYGVTYIIANDVIAASMFKGYSRVDQAISELSGTEAPSKRFLAGMLPVFSVLMLGFGAGVWRAGGRFPALRATGALLFVQGAMFPLWLRFPMTSREALVRGAGGANDVGHVALSVLAVLLIVGEMATGAAALGARFRDFSLAAAVAVLSAGAYVATKAPATAAGASTRWMGLVERISYGAWLLWMAVLAVVLLRKPAGAWRARVP